MKHDTRRVRMLDVKGEEGCWFLSPRLFVFIHRVILSLWTDETVSSFTCVMRYSTALFLSLS